MAFNFPNAPAVNDIYVAAPGLNYKWNGEVWMIDSGTVRLATTRRVITYGGAGTYQYVKPAGLKDITIELWGAGGGSSGTAATAAGQQSCGNSGGAGGYTRKLYQASELGASEPLVLGAGGTAGAAGGVAGTGATSTFKGLSAFGGGGGAVPTAGTNFSPGSIGGPGGSSGGDFNGRGNFGALCSRFYLSTASIHIGTGGAPFGNSNGNPSVGGAVTSGLIPGGTSGAGFGGNPPAQGQSLAAAPGYIGGDAFAIITETFWDADTLSVAPILSSIKVTTQTASGTYTKPAGLKYLEVTIIGGGGGSAGVPATAAAQASASGGGGGGGTVIKLYAAGDLSATEVYTIGTGGTAAPTAGGASTFKGLTAGGGSPSAASASTATIGSTTAGGTGGAVSGGDLNIFGGTGGMGVANSHGRTGFALPGGGGSSFLSIPAVMQGYQTGTIAIGGIGRSPGGGAQGAANGASQATTAGAAGAEGAIIFKEYY